MKKFLCMGLACLALLAMMAVPAFSCDQDKTTTTSASTGNSTTDGKLVGSDSKASCAGMKNASATSADGKSCCAAHGSMTSASAANGQVCPYAGMQMVSMSVKGMTCSHCESQVRASLEKTPGVMKVMSVSYKDGTAQVCIDPTKCKAETLASVVSDKGFEAQVIPAVAKTTTTADGKNCAGMDKAACAAKCAAAKADNTTKTPEDSK